MSADIQVLDKVFEPYIDEVEIDNAITKLADILNEKYKDNNPIFIPILNGAFMFTSDLIKKINIPCEVCFVKLASYKGTSTTNKVVQAIGLEANLLDRCVILLDDILDTGTTIDSFINNDLKYRQPKSIEIVVLFHKHNKTIYDFENKIVGMKVLDKFLVGYGLDYDGYGRNFRDVYQLI